MASEKPEEPHAKPKGVTDVLPTSLQVAGWTIPIVIGLVGLVKTVTDMTIAAQAEIRARANAEIAFFDKQYDYATRMGLDEKAQPLLRASVDALLSRREPDFYVNRMFDWALLKQRDQALFLVCASRKVAFDTYTSGAVGAVSVQFRGTLEGLKEMAPKSPPGSGAVLLQQYESDCRKVQASQAVILDAARADAAAPVAALPPAAVPAPVPAQPAPAPAAHPASPTQTPPVQTPISTAADCATPPNLPETAGSAPTARSHQGPVGGWDLDVFWCANADAQRARANYQAACSAYQTLASRPQVGGETVGRVRLRRLPVSLQNGKGYPNAGTMIRYDIGQASEQLLSDQIGQTVWPGRYKLQPSYSGTRWYVSVFSCGPN